MLEIYNECILDLLSSDDTKLDIKQNVDGQYVPGLTQVSVNNLDEVNMVSVIDIPYSLILANIEYHTLWSANL